VANLCAAAGVFNSGIRQAQECIRLCDSSNIVEKFTSKSVENDIISCVIFLAFSARIAGRIQW